MTETRVQEGTPATRQECALDTDVLACLLDSAMHVTEGPLAGAIRAGYDSRSGRPLWPYTEISGYQLSLYALLVGTGHLRRDDPHIEALIRYLSRVQTSEGAFLDVRRSTPDQGVIYAFDTAVCATGLLQWGRLATDARALDMAERAVQWLLAEEHGGSLAAGYSLPGRAVVMERGFGKLSAAHAKIAIPLFLASEIHTGAGRSAHGRPEDAARRILSRALALQEPNGAFRQEPGSRRIFAHTVCYALEAVLVALRHSTGGDRDRLARAFLAGARWLRAQQAKTGWLRQTDSLGPLVTVERFARDGLGVCASDATAQAARIWGAAYLLSADEAYLVAAENALAGLRHARRVTIVGGGGSAFPYTRSRFGFGRICYTWPLQFAVAADLTLSSLRSGNPPGVDALAQAIF